MEINVLVPGKMVFILKEILTPPSSPGWSSSWALCPSLPEPCQIMNWNLKNNQQVPFYCQTLTADIIEGWLSMRWSDLQSLQFDTKLSLWSTLMRYQSDIYTLLILKLEDPGRTRSMPWQLIPWLLTSPGHQQSVYWICNINQSLSSTENFNNPQVLSGGWPGDPLPPGFHPPTPAQFFPPNPRPTFCLIFQVPPALNSDFPPRPRPFDPHTPPIFHQKPTYPPPPTPGPPSPLSDPISQCWETMENTNIFSCSQK